MLPTQDPGGSTRTFPRETRSLHLIRKMEIEQKAQPKLKHSLVLGACKMSHQPSQTPLPTLGGTRSRIMARCATAGRRSASPVKSAGPTRPSCLVDRRDLPSGSSSRPRSSETAGGRNSRDTTAHQPHGALQRRCSSGAAVPISATVVSGRPLLDGAQESIAVRRKRFGALHHRPPPRPFSGKYPRLVMASRKLFRLLIEDGYPSISSRTRHQTWYAPNDLGTGVVVQPPDTCRPDKPLAPQCPSFGCHTDKTPVGKRNRRARPERWRPRRVRVARLDGPEFAQHAVERQ